MSFRKLLILAALVAPLSALAQSTANPPADTSLVFGVGPCFATVFSKHPLVLVTESGKKNIYVMGNVPVSGLDTTQVKSVKIMNDAAMTAIYGSRAASGVIHATVSVSEFRRLKAKGLLENRKN